jgi:hypothetical protein
MCFGMKNILKNNHYHTPKQSFQTRTGPAGWPGTRPTHLTRDLVIIPGRPPGRV